MRPVVDLEITPATGFSFPVWEIRMLRDNLLLDSCYMTQAVLVQFFRERVCEVNNRRAMEQLGIHVPIRENRRL